MPNRSTTTNLVEYVSFVKKQLDRGNQVDAIYTDIKAAFDSVQHDLLLAKLAALGISLPAIRWLHSYISGRKYNVKVGTQTSRTVTSSSGLPQGSNLGPLLFLLFMNDVTLAIPGCKHLMYADDIKLFTGVQFASDCDQLQHHLEGVNRWCIDNGLSLSIGKCQAITFSRARNPVRYLYSVNDIALERAEVICDLGVLLDCPLDFIAQYNSIIESGNQMLNLVQECPRNCGIRSALRPCSVHWCGPSLNTEQSCGNQPHRFGSIVLKLSNGR